MNIAIALRTVDLLKPNNYPDSVLINWLSTLDGKLYAEVFSKRKGNPRRHGFEGYNEKTDPDTTELLVPWPYGDDLYIFYLQMCIDRENGETRKYNADAQQFNTAYKEFCDYWNRTHPPVHRKRFLF